MIVSLLTIYTCVSNMASFIKHKQGWRALVSRKGVRKSKVFPTKRAAQDWATQIEYDLTHNLIGGTKHTVGHAFDRYAKEVSSAKKGARWEIIRLKKLETYPIAKLVLADLKPADIAAWRDERLKEVLPASVRREMNLMSSVFNVARKEWGWTKSTPMSDVKKPPQSKRRDRIASDDEMKALGISAGSDPSKKICRAFLAFRFAVETGMRAGEIVGLEWSRVNLSKRTAHLPDTKNGEARDVPLSSEAVGILKLLPKANKVFDLSSGQLVSLWRKLRDRAGVEDLTFHDSRHMAVTRLSKKLDVLDLARVIGHRDIRMLLTYYNANAEELAKKLD